MSSDTPLLSRDLARATMRGVRADLLASRQIVLTARDPVGIHRTRVALRRLRAALALFRGPLAGDTVLDRRAEAAKFARACGPAREIDVFLAGDFAAAAAVLRALPRASEALAAFRATAMRLRRTRHDAARAILNGSAFAAFDAALLDWLDASDTVNPDESASPDVPAVPAVLGKRHRRVARQLKRLDDLDAAQRHELRLQVKKQRYAAAFLGGFFDPVAVRSYIEALTALQDALGVANDRAEALRIVREIAAAARPTGRLDAIAGALGGWLLATGKRRAENDIARAARRFARQSRFWRNEGN